MDRRLCTQTLVARCSVLLAYHRRSVDAWGREELRHELGWLAADARRWGIEAEAVAAGVLSELRLCLDDVTAASLLADLEEAFGLEAALA